jgi:tetratricopeptide (TPR) repeat protein/predicted aspartyl protease
MSMRCAGLVCVGIAVCACPVAAAEHCALQSFAELPVTMEGLRPVVVLQVNGADTRFVVDSGAFYSMLTPAAAAELKLPTRPAPLGLRVGGVGGIITPRIATVDTLTLAGYPFHRVEFLVGINETGAGTIGLLGENLIRLADVEYDLPNGVMRFIKPAKDCAHQALAYWATPSQPIAAIDLESPTPVTPWPIGWVTVDGVRVKAAFDTGAATSVLFLHAARRAGITPETPGVIPAGVSTGIGGRFIASWIAPVTSFGIGGEQVSHTHLRVADVRTAPFDMLIGDDWFLSHRIYVANSQHKLYFTYQGGPVFNLEFNARAQGSSRSLPASSSAAAEEAARSTTAALGHFADQPTEAAAFMRRGVAYAAQRDFKSALADLERASQLAPTEPDYRYELGRVQWQSGRSDLALRSFDKAIELRPDYVSARMARAQLQLNDHTRAKEDLDAVDRIAPPQDSVRLQLGSMYAGIEEFPAAIHEYDLWIDSHREDVGRAFALGARCWAQAEANQMLDRALQDCNDALRLSRNNPDILDSRGLVRLRRGELDLAIKDYDAALAGRPKLASSLCGRGLAELQKGQRAQGQTDLAAAAAIQPKIAERFARLGLTP